MWVRLAGAAAALLAVGLVWAVLGQATQRDAAAQRLDMIEQQIQGRGVTDLRVLEAMRTVPRERFVPPDVRGRAYEDRPLPIGGDRLYPSRTSWRT